MESFGISCVCASAISFMNLGNWLHWKVTCWRRLNVVITTTNANEWYPNRGQIWTRNYLKNTLKPTMSLVFHPLFKRGKLSLLSSPLFGIGIKDKHSIICSWNYQSRQWLQWPLAVEQLSKTSVKWLSICVTVTSEQYTYFGQVSSSWLIDTQWWESLRRHRSKAEL